VLARFPPRFPAGGSSTFFFQRDFFSDVALAACCVGLVFLAAIVLGRLWRRFIGVAASAPLFVLFNILLLWGVYVFVIRRGELVEHRLIANAGALVGCHLDAVDFCEHLLFLSCCIQLSEAEDVS